MNRNTLTHFILETYSISPEFLWPRYPRYAVFRHPTNRKWFALIANVPRTKLGLPSEQSADLSDENPAGLPGDGDLDLLNLKLDPDLIDSLRGRPGIFPAYHMNKTHWLSLALDGSVAPDLLQSLLAHSFTLTQKNPHKNIFPSFRWGPGAQAPVYELISILRTETRKQSFRL